MLLGQLDGVRGLQEKLCAAIETKGSGSGFRRLYKSARDVFQREASGAFRLCTGPDPRTSMLCLSIWESAAAKRAIFLA